MSKQLDNLIAILSESDHQELCKSANCGGVPNCGDCPLDDEADLLSTIKELEVLQHAKA